MFLCVDVDWFCVSVNWFDMPAPTVTPQWKKDIQLLKLRSVIDPKRHYKKGYSNSKTLHKYFQASTVIESTSDFFTVDLLRRRGKLPLLMSYFLFIPLGSTGCERFERLKNEAVLLGLINGRKEVNSRGNVLSKEDTDGFNREPVKGFCLAKKIGFYVDGDPY
ncbi:uncharacterized protein LOC130763651 [Actinidia eriantha]|uniref:uncharacterized protein LOC130763651 n=1 Tax=Actinidia eriantha TaxID=165200 RepID=UPI002589A533|nr:uncharacterized protein LOC130763651 [Actinidia eriantha]